MNNPWGISGPEFLWLYGGALVAALAWAVLVRVRARRPRLAEPPPTPDAESLAFLAGGARRVTELSIARLLHAERLRTSRKGYLTATHPVTDPDDPMDLAVMRGLGMRSIQVGELIRKVSAVRHLERLAGTLSARGLLLAPEAAARVKRWSVLPLYVLLAVGVVRFVVGAANLFPVGYLAVELVVTIVVLVALSRQRIRPRTVHGDRALDAARHTASGIELVAVDGLGAYPDETLRAGLVKGNHARVGSLNSWTYGSHAGGVYAACAATATYGGSGDGGGGGSSCGGGGGGGCGGGGSS